MPRQITGQWPATERRYVPEAHGNPDYREREQIVSLVRVLERGPDVSLVVFSRGIPSRHPLDIPARDEAAFLSRLFRDAPLADREALQVILQGFEDAVLAGDAGGMVIAWRRAMAVYDTMAADLHALSGLPAAQRGAA